MNTLRNWFFPPGLPAWRYWLRLLVVALQLLLAYCLAEQNNPFFYQGF